MLVFSKLHSASNALLLATFFFNPADAVTKVAPGDFIIPMLKSQDGSFIYLYNEIFGLLSER
jgi:hypothetical protein